MRITKRNADEGLRRMHEALDMVIQNCGPHGYLVGSCFSLPFTLVTHYSAAASGLMIVYTKSRARRRRAAPVRGLATLHSSE